MTKQNPIRELRTHFPNTDAEAKLYGGFLNDSPLLFTRVFDSRGNLENDIAEINKFLIDNGYCEAPIDEFDETYSFENDVYSI